MHDILEKYVKSLEPFVSLPASAKDLDRLIEIEKINGMIEIAGALAIIAVALENLEGNTRK